MSHPALAPLLPPDNGFRSLLGFRVLSWGDGRASIELEIGPQHLNAAGVLHGGVYAALLDAACGLCGTWRPLGETPRACVTLSLTTSFTRQISAGRICAVATRRSQGRRIYHASAEVLDEQQRLLAFGEACLRYRGAPE
ncbi:hypothetical protein VK98_04795 [Chromobacterium sp. LK11]|uniref:PaaI family thioesterase n=1 Tax=Chromobacterium sp. LK11 TaxID=1628212 RepID=UPI00065475C0|nr:PaaI family thioesterase [Chromobacterium sp. LK11]KMN82826.1 hypothetical protein VK98_04795 [Chromobacterium sp. LK11]